MWQGVQSNTTVLAQGSEDSSEETVSSFHHVDSGDQTQVIRFQMPILHRTDSMPLYLFLLGKPVNETLSCITKYIVYPNGFYF